MVTRTVGVLIRGLEGRRVEVEVDIGGGFDTKFTVVGLALGIGECPRPCWASKRREGDSSSAALRPSAWSRALVGEVDVLHDAEEPVGVVPGQVSALSDQEALVEEGAKGIAQSVQIRRGQRPAA